MKISDLPKTVSIFPLASVVFFPKTILPLNIFEDKELISTHDLLAMHQVKKVNIILRIIRSFNYLIWGDV